MKVVIFAGGNASRLWPTVTKGVNKPFIKFFNGKTSLELIYSTVNKKFKKNDIYISTGKEFAGDIKKILPEFPDKNLILEPISKDSGPAVIYAFFNIIKEVDPDEPVLILWTNGVIKDPELFIESINAAEEQFKNEKLNLMFFGVPQRYPNTGVGHIKGDQLSRKNIDSSIFIQDFEDFEEKPTLEVAEKYYMKSDEFFWNTGYYIARPSFILEEVEKHNQEFFKKFSRLTQLISDLEKNDDEIRSVFEAVEKCSIDYLLWEKITYENVKVIVADYKWHYISRWDQLSEVLKKDSDGNTFEGSVKDLNLNDCYIRNEEDGKVVVGIGLKDIVVINSKEGVLVLNKKDAGKVRDIVS